MEKDREMDEDSMVERVVKLNDGFRSTGKDNINEKKQREQEQLMLKEDKYDIFSIKCIAASFVATYFSGVVHPLEIIKTRYQSHDGKSSHNLVPKYNGIKSALKMIYKDEGFKGLYKGFYISLLCQASAMSFFFWQYETRKSTYEAQKYTKMEAVTYASIEASILSTFITQPIWVIKTRMLLNLNKKISQLQNCKNQIRQLYSQYGLKGFLKGIQLSLILSLSGVVQMYTYEGSKMVYESCSIPETPFNEKHFICGSISKVFSVLLSYPITTIRTRIQQNQFVDGSSQEKYCGIINLGQKTLKQEGIRGFYKGISANLMRGMTQKGIYFYCYQLFKDQLFMKSEVVY